VLDPATMSDSDLETLADELRRFLAGRQRADLG
jgi:hypothetical protein